MVSLGYNGNRVVLEMLVLQMGQFEFLCNQTSMQSMWNMWVQLGMILNRSSSWNSFKQTAHSHNSSFSDWFSGFLNWEIGIDWIVYWSRPLFWVGGE